MGNACAEGQCAHNTRKCCFREGSANQVDGTFDEFHPMSDDAVVVRSDVGVVRPIDYPRLRLGQDSDSDVDTYRSLDTYRSDRQVDSYRRGAPVKSHRQHWAQFEGEKAFLQEQRRAVEQEMRELLVAKADLERRAVKQEKRDLLAAKAELESLKTSLSARGRDSNSLQNLLSPLKSVEERVTETADDEAIVLEYPAQDPSMESKSGLFAKPRAATISRTSPKPRVRLKCAFSDVRAPDSDRRDAQPKDTKVHSSCQRPEEAQRAVSVGSTVTGAQVGHDTRSSQFLNGRQTKQSDGELNELPAPSRPSSAALSAPMSSRASLTASSSAGSLGPPVGPMSSSRTSRTSFRSASRPAPQDEQPSLFTKRGLEVVFLDLDGNEKTKYIGRRPLGAKFARQVHGRAGGPVRVNQVSHPSLANDLGIQVGWLVKGVAGQDVSQWRFEEAQKALSDGVEKLPEA